MSCVSGGLRLRGERAAALLQVSIFSSALLVAGRYLGGDDLFVGELGMMEEERSSETQASRPTKIKTVDAALEAFEQRHREGMLGVLVFSPIRGLRHDLALQTYQQIIDRYKEPPIKAMAMFRKADVYDEAGEWELATETFQGILKMAPGDGETESGRWPSVRESQNLAARRIASIRFDQGRYAEALEAYVAAERDYPYVSFCGNDVAESRYWSAYHQGRCKEHLGRADEAAVDYFRTLTDQPWPLRHDEHPSIHRRLVELYVASGQRAQLEHILDELDLQIMREVVEHSAKPLNDEELQQHREDLPTRVTRQLLHIRGMAATNQWDALMDMLEPDVSSEDVLLFCESPSSGEFWASLDAARELAKHANETTPRLIQRLGSLPHSRDRSFYRYALGLCGTPEALAVLASELTNPFVNVGMWDYENLTFALATAGSAGEEVLTRVAKARPDLARRIESRQDWSDPLESRRWPVVPKDIRLPQTLAEVDVAVAAKRQALGLDKPVKDKPINEDDIPYAIKKHAPK